MEEPVVGGEHDQRVVELAPRLERVHDGADGVVDREQGLQLLAVVLGDGLLRDSAEPFAARDDVGLVAHVGLVERRVARQPRRAEEVAVVRRGGGGLQRRRVVRLDRRAAVRGGQGQREEERSPARGDAPDLLGRPPGEVVGLVLERPRQSRQLEDQAVLVHLPAVEAERRGVDRRDPAVPSGRDLGEVRVLDPVAVQVAADVDGLVAGCLEPERKRVGAVEARVAAERPGVLHHAVVVGVLAGQVGRARRAAEGEARDRLGERRAAVAQQRADVAHDAQGLGRLVVGHDEHDVRAAARAAAPRRPRGRGGGPPGRRGSVRGAPCRAKARQRVYI